MSDALLHAHGDPVLRAAMRSSAEDFSVEELPAFEASGVGEHLLLTIEKRNTNTAYAAQRLAEWAGVGEVAIGYAGLKDRHAVTRQRFTVHLPKRAAPDLAALESDTLHVVDYAWHARKLPRGALAGNRFVLVLRDVVAAARHDVDGVETAHGESSDSPADAEDSAGLHKAVDTRLHAIAHRGVPNYFGEQRFGRGGDNVANALSMFAQAAALAARDAARDAQGGTASGKRRRLPRDQRTFLLSAARSQLFNQVLSARVADGSWDTGLEGEVWMLDGSRSVFGPEPINDALARRLAEFDIHPSGPLWGRGDVRALDAALAVEQHAMHDARSAALQAGLEAAGLKQERRSLRLRAGELAWTWLDARTLQLRFDLQPGAYATTVLSELGNVQDASQRQGRAAGPGMEPAQGAESGV